MISKNQIKYLKSLHRSKGRKTHRHFIVEGTKIVLEAINSGLDVSNVFVTSGWLQANTLPQDLAYVEVDEKELSVISQLNTPSGILAVLAIPSKSSKLNCEAGKWCVGLESVRDPGNIGAIIRTADWFGIGQVLLSEDCVDIYNAKVIQSTMGSMFRLDIISLTIEDMIAACTSRGLPVYGATLEGENINNLDSLTPGLILFGNESKGLSDLAKGALAKQLFIPGNGDAESLNVGVSVGIILSKLTM